MRAIDRQTCISPEPAAVISLGGYRMPYLNRSVEIFASMLEEEDEYVSKLFKRNEWIYLLGILGNDWPARKPGAILADKIEAIESTFGGATKNQIKPQRLEEICEICRSLDSTHAWVMLWALGWAWDNQDRINLATDPWWTLAYRRQNAKRKGDPSSRKRAARK